MRGGLARPQLCSMGLPWLEIEQGRSTLRVDQVGGGGVRDN